MIKEAINFGSEFLLGVVILLLSFTTAPDWICLTLATIFAVHVFSSRKVEVE